jgi:hypothetical protein
LFFLSLRQQTQHPSSLQVRLWHVRTGEELDHLRSGVVHPVYTVALSPDESTVAEASLDPVVRLWAVPPRVDLLVARHGDAVAEAERKSFHMRETVQSVQATRSTRRQAKFSYFQAEPAGDRAHETAAAAVIPPAGQATPAVQLRGHSAAIVVVLFAPDGATLASGAHDGTVIVWDLREHTLLHRLSTLAERPVWSCAFAHDGSLLAAGTGAGDIELWDPHAGSLLHAFHAHASDVDACAFSGDGLRLATGGADRAVRVWKLLPADQLLQLWRKQRADEEDALRQSETASLASQSHTGGSLTRRGSGHLNSGGARAREVVQSPPLTEPGDFSDDGLTVAGDTDTSRLDTSLGPSETHAPPPKAPAPGFAVELFTNTCGRFFPLRTLFMI